MEVGASSADDRCYPRLRLISVASQFPASAANRCASIAGRQVYDRRDIAAPTAAFATEMPPSPESVPCIKGKSCSGENGGDNSH